MRRFLLLVWAVIIVAGILTEAIAKADELPCRANGSGTLATVTCSRQAFDTLVEQSIDADAEIKKQEVRLREAARTNTDLRMSLAACVDHGVQVSHRRQYPIFPLILAAVGGAVIGASIAGDWPSGGRTSGVVVGSAVIGTGLIVALF